MTRIPFATCIQFPTRMPFPTRIPFPTFLLYFVRSFSMSHSIRAHLRIGVLIDAGWGAPSLIQQRPVQLEVTQPEVTAKSSELDSPLIACMHFI